MPDTRPDNHRTKPEHSPDAACFSAPRLSLRRRRKGWCLPPTCLSRRAPHSRFSLTFFPSRKQHRSGEGVGSSPRVLQRAASAVEAKRRGLTRFPRSVHSPAKNGRFLPLLSFQHVYARSPPRLPTTTPSPGFSFLAACFLQVRLRERVNRPFFALLPPTSLTPHALTQVNQKLLCSSHSGVTCHPYPPCEPPFGEHG
jgi:hypothetical protein